MANVTSGWRIPQLAFERGEWEGERDSQLIEVTSNTWQLPHLPWPSYASSHNSLIINKQTLRLITAAHHIAHRQLGQIC